jgi:hypothetical protein
VRRISRLLLPLLAIAMAAACSRRQPKRSVELPTGDAVWLAGGVGPGEPDIEPSLARGGFTTVFLPAGRLVHEGGRWTASEISLPTRALARPAVFLVVGSDPPAAPELATPERARAWANLLWLAVQPSLRDRARFGRVVGVHLDVPFERADPGSFAAAVSSIRSRIPAGMALTVSLRAVPGEKDAARWQVLADAVDGFVAFVFGPGSGAHPAATDRMGKPWWSGYSVAATGSWTDPAGQEQGPLEEGVLARLTDSPRVDFVQNISLKEDSDSSFLLRPREAVTVGASIFPRGSRIDFRQPSLADMIERMGRDLSGRRWVRGRVVELPGGSDADRIFTLASLVSVLSGGPLEPDLRAALATDHRSIEISAENASPNTSVISRTSNWVEADVPDGGIRDVQPGGFDRYEVFGRDGQPALLGRATRVRFYETLVSPYEKIAPARIVVRRVPAGCCAVRTHVLAASGKDVVK